MIMIKIIKFVLSTMLCAVVLTAVNTVEVDATFYDNEGALAYHSISINDTSLSVNETAIVTMVTVDPATGEGDIPFYGSIAYISPSGSHKYFGFYSHYGTTYADISFGLYDEPGLWIVDQVYFGKGEDWFWVYNSNSDDAQFFDDVDDFSHMNIMVSGTLGDEIPPTINAYSIDLDRSITFNEYTRIKVYAEDNESGFVESKLLALYQHADGYQKYFLGYINEDFGYIDIYFNEFESSAAGNWRLAELSVEDQAGNIRTIYNSLLYPTQSPQDDFSEFTINFTRTNLNDVEDPNITDYYFSSDSVEEGQTVQFNVVASDIGCGIRNGVVKIVDPNGFSFDYELYPVEGGLSGSWSFTDLDFHGLWAVKELTVTDRCGNDYSIVDYDWYSWDYDELRDLSGFVVDYVGENTDTTGPVILDFTQNDTVFQPYDFVEVTIDVSEQSGMYYSSIVFVSPSGDMKLHMYLEMKNGVLVGQFPILPNTEPGFWKLDYIILDDTFKNRTFLYNMEFEYYYLGAVATDFSNYGFFVENVVDDTEKPIVRSARINTLTANPGTSMEVQVDAADIGSAGIRSGKIKFVHESGNQFFTSELGYGYSSEPFNSYGMYANFQANDTWYDGLWQIDSIELTDVVGNVLIVFNSALYSDPTKTLMDLSAGNFDFINPGAVDLSPTITGISINDTVLEVGETLRFTIDVELNGDVQLDYGYIAFITPQLTRAYIGLSPVGNQLIGETVIESIDSPGLWSVEYVFVVDLNGEYDEVANAAFYPDDQGTWLWNLDYLDFEILSDPGDDTTPPVVEGVEDLHYYNSSRLIAFNEGTATLNGVAFSSGSTVVNAGTYTLVVTDASGNSTTVRFVIDKTAPIISGLTSSIYVDKTPTITFNEGTATLNGNPFTSGTAVSDLGDYVLRVTDLAGNVTEKTFKVIAGVGSLTGLSIKDLDYNQLTLAWNPSSNATGYEVYRATTSTGTYTKIATVTTTEAVLNALSFNTTYYYKVRAYLNYEGGTTYSAYSSVISGKTALKAVSNPSAQSAGYASIQVNWSAVSGASGYEVWRSTGTSTTYALVKTQTTVGFLNTALVTNTTYNFKIRAYRLVGTTKVYGAYSSVVSTKPIPSVPTISVVSGGTNALKVSWPAVAGASGYEVSYAATEEGTYTLLPLQTALSATISGLTVDAPYFVKVRAYRLVGTLKVYSGYSTIVSAKPLPLTPTLTGTSGGFDRVNLSWSAIAGAAGYELYRLDGDTYTLISDQTTLSYTDDELITGTTRSYKVVAYAILSEVKIRSLDSTVLNVTPIPSTVLGLKLSSTNYTIITIDWTDVSGASGYEISFATTSTGAASVVGDVSVSEFTRSGLTFNTTGYYRVRAYTTVNDIKVYGNWTTALAVKTALSSVNEPSAQSAGYASIHVNWSGVSGASGYEVWRSTGTSTTYALVKTQTTVGFLNTALVTNTTYNFKIRAYRLVGTTKVYGAYSSVVSTKPIPSVPSISVVSGGTNALKVSWPAVAGASGYEVSYAATEDGTYTLLPLQTATTSTISGLTVDTPYYVKVRAYRLVGTLRVYSGYSAIVSAKPLPLTPTLSGSSGGFDRVNLSWSAIAGAAGYELYRLDGDTYTLISDQTTLSYTDVELVTGTTRSYKVVAYAILSEVKIRSLDSTVLNVTPIPSLATNLKAAFIDYNLLSLDWTDVSGATGYEISFATTATGAASVIADVSVSEFTRTGLTFNTTGYYRVRAYTTVSDIKVTGNWTSALAVKTALTAVSNPSAAYTSYNSIQINWSAVNGASGYEVWRSTGTSTTYALVKTQTTVGFLNTALVTNTRYNYKIRAYRLVGTTKVYGAYSSIVSSTPLPWAPNPTAASAAYNALKISWPAVVGANGYEVSYATSEAGPFTVLPTTTLTSATITNLLTNSTYTVRVRAYRTVNYKKVYGAYSSFHYRNADSFDPGP
jgi:hypothetical protein